MLITKCRSLFCAIVYFACFACVGSIFAQADPHRGLWVGTVSLRGVNEVSVSKNAAGDDIAPVPAVPTPTFDEANLRLILHVNGAGQANLLKDVAILNWVENAGEQGVFASESDLSLVTDPRLYPSFPAQQAQRIGSVAFDFGDAEATKALDAVVDESVRLATELIMMLDRATDLETEGKRVQAAQAAAATIVSSNTTIVMAADVADAFEKFLQAFNQAQVDLVVDGDATALADNEQLAIDLRDRSFYSDARGVEMFEAITNAVADTNVSLTARMDLAQNIAASFEDVANTYQGFIAGKLFGDMIVAGADKAAEVAGVPGATPASIELLLRGIPESTNAIFKATISQAASDYRDSRAMDALDAVTFAMAVAAYSNRTALASDIRAASEQAGRSTLSDMVARYPLPVQTPTADYNDWVKSDTFAESAQIAADSAAKAAVANRHASALSSAESVGRAARDAAITDLGLQYAAAARAMRTELPLTGTFAPGSGFTNLVSDLNQPSDLGTPGGLEGTILLPARHPTNPFLHFRHPDHTSGFNIRREIRLDFDPITGASLENAAYGVDRISGTYREEIFGLHKPLGTNPGTAPIGLKSEGRFVLNRISYIDTLNSR